MKDPGNEIRLMVNYYLQPRPQGLLLDDVQNGGSSGEGPGKGWQNLQKSWRFLSRDILKKNGGKASRENQDSGQNTYLKTCKLYARDIDSYVVRWNIIFSDVWNLELDFCAVKVRV